MKNTVTCVILTLLLLLSCGLVQLEHPIAHDATEANLLLATDDDAGYDMHLS